MLRSAALRLAAAPCAELGLAAACRGGLRASGASAARGLAAGAQATPSVVKVPADDAEYARLLKGSTGVYTTAESRPAETEGLIGAVVTQFTAVWCGPCRFIAPAVEKLAAEHSGRVSFLKVDIDAEALQGTVNASGVAAVPTFVFHVAGKEVERFSGADAAKLQATVAELAQEVART